MPLLQVCNVVGSAVAAVIAPRMVATALLCSYMQLCMVRRRLHCREISRHFTSAPGSTFAASERTQNV